MLAPAQPANERQRLSTLHSLQILDTPPEERFDRLTRMARRLFDVPIALISLIDSNRQWFKSSAGLGVHETPRAVSFCGHAILNDQLLLVPDAGSDERFAGNPMVVGAPGIRFYAGCPLRVADGSNIGTLCLIDTRPRTLDAEERGLFRDLASMAEQEIEAVQRSTVDPLTQVVNRRGFEALTAHALSICKRMGTPASLLLFELDQLHEIQQGFGDAAVDHALLTFAQVLGAVVREMDTVGRMAGSGFAALLMGSAEHESRAIAERFLGALAVRNQQEDRGYPIRCTIRLSEYDPARHATVQSLFSDAAPCEGR